MFKKALKATLLASAELNTLARSETYSYLDDNGRAESIFEGFATGSSGSYVVDGNFVGESSITPAGSRDIAIKW